MKKNKKTNVDVPASHKQAEKGKPLTLHQMHPAWSFSLCDLYHEKWGIYTNEVYLADLIKKFKEWETSTWEDVLTNTGGRKSGTQSHPIPVASLIRDAQKRLAEMHLDEYEELYSLALTGRRRIWGIMIPETGTFQFLWYDSEHAIYPVDKK